MALGRRLTAKERQKAKGTPIHGAASKLKGILGGGAKPAPTRKKGPSLYDSTKKNQASAAKAKAKAKADGWVQVNGVWKKKGSSTNKAAAAKSLGKRIGGASGAASIRDDRPRPKKTTTRTTTSRSTSTRARPAAPAKTRTKAQNTVGANAKKRTSAVTRITARTGVSRKTAAKMYKRRTK